MAQTYFASIQPGLEPALLTEVRRMGGKRARILDGGVEFDAARKTLYAAHLQLTTPTRIWLRVDEFRACDAPELYNKTRRYGWERLLGGEHAIQVRANSSKSRLYHTGKIRDAVVDALRDRFDQDLDNESTPTFVDSGGPDVQCIMVRLHDDRCQLNLDASGDMLHRRGWRTEIGEAPLRESIAAAMLETIEWKPEYGLVDPMCGSGTIPGEAACRAVDSPPGLQRSFAFQKWRNFQPERYSEIRGKMRDDINDTVAAPIIGRDKDSNVIEVARRNLDRAGVADFVELSVADLSDTALPDGDYWIVTNPPYGSRLEDGNALTYLLDAWKGRDGDGELCFLWPRERRAEVADHHDGALQPVTTFKNGGLSVDLWHSG